jgi:formylglycine-generating enzyme required for sulfatase activity
MKSGLTLFAFICCIGTCVSPAPASLNEIRRNAEDGLKYVLIPPGVYRMGCSEDDNECGPKEKPAHTVTLTKAFWIGQAEVTVGAYKRFAVAMGRKMPAPPVFTGRSSVASQINPNWRYENRPMVDISWDDAAAYCRWAGGRLPTEAEWEFAARAGEKSASYGKPEDIAWYADNSGRAPLDTQRLRAAGNNAREIVPLLAPNGNQPHAVSRKMPNAFGVFDMLGNAFEWVADWYGPYTPEPSTDPAGPPTGEERVIRGGNFGTPRWAVRLSLRASDGQTHHDAGIGFRCALDH